MNLSVMKSRLGASNFRNVVIIEIDFLRQNIIDDKGKFTVDV